MSPSCPHRGPWLAALDRQWVATKRPASGSPDWAAVDDQQCVARFLPICHPIAIWLLCCGIALLTCSARLRADLRRFHPRPTSNLGLHPALFGKSQVLPRFGEFLSTRTSSERCACLDSGEA